MNEQLIFNLTRRSAFNREDYFISSTNNLSIKILDNWNINIDECVYVGDSPNDSPMFKKFPISVGVKSVLDYSDFMKDYPSYVTERDGNQGFEDLVDSILSTK